ncbi:MAG: hypothetical protein ACRD88_14325 [Terriglobia bacterium]
MKILFSGKQGKLYDAVLRTIAAHRRGKTAQGQRFQAEAVPPGPPLLEMARSGSYAAVIFVLENEPDSEPVRWLLQSAPALPLITVLPGGNTRLRKELQREGVSQVIEAGELSESALRRIIHERLAALPSKPPDVPETASAITTDLHGIRSSLTAIQGMAELALKKIRGPGSSRKPLESIVQEVTEVEGLLRRIERKVKPHRPSPPK